MKIFELVTRHLARVALEPGKGDLCECEDPECGNPILPSWPRHLCPGDRCDCGRGNE